MSSEERDERLDRFEAHLDSCIEATWPFGVTLGWMLMLVGISLGLALVVVVLTSLIGITASLVTWARRNAPPGD